MVTIEYLHQIAILDYVQWDLKTITSADYTVEFDIKKEFYEDFLAVKKDLNKHQMANPRFFSEWMTK